MCRTPSAFDTALTNAGSDAVQPDSPMPLMPKGPNFDSVVYSSIWMDLSCPARGMM